MPKYALRTAGSLTQHARFHISRLQKAGQGSFFAQDIYVRLTRVLTCRCYIRLIARCAPVPLRIKDLRYSASNDVMRVGSELDRMQAQAHTNPDTFAMSFFAKPIMCYGHSLERCSVQNAYMSRLPNLDFVAVVQEGIDDGAHGKQTRVRSLVL